MISKVNRVQLSYVLLSIMTFIVLSLQYDSSWFRYMDRIIIEFISTFFDEDWLSFYKFISDVGSYKITYPLLLLISFALLIFKKYIFFILFVVNFYGVRFLNIVLKEFFERDRPPVFYHLVKASNFSFPSGHSMNSMAFYGLMCWALLQLPNLQKRMLKAIFITFFSCLILFIGISRVYLRVHFPTDVIGGFLAGSAWFFILILSYKYVLKSLNKEMG